MSDSLAEQAKDKVKPVMKRWRRRRKLMVIGTAASAGAAAAYYLDPETGAGRREKLKSRYSAPAGY